MGAVSSIDANSQFRRQILEDFEAEALDYLGAAEAILIRAEREGLSASDQAELHRAVHTISGTAGCLRLVPVQLLAAALETASSKLAGAGPDDPRLALFVDGLSELRDLVESPDEPRDANPSLLTALKAMSQANATSAPAVVPGRRSVLDVFFDVAAQQRLIMETAAQLMTEGGGENNAPAMLHRAINTLRSAAQYAEQPRIIEVLDQADQFGDFPGPENVKILIADLRVVLESNAVDRADDVRPDSPEIAVEPAINASAYGSSDIAQVTQESTESLITQMGDLVTVRNQIQHFMESLERAGEARVACRQGKALALALGRAVDDMASAVTKLRMVCLETILVPLSRAATDSAAKEGRQVRVETLGGEIEIDRSVAQMLLEQIRLLLQEATTYRIEPPQRRLIAGKQPEGMIRISAQRTASDIVINISDDGEDWDVKQIRSRAIASGLLNAESADGMSESEVLGLLLTYGSDLVESCHQGERRSSGVTDIRSAVGRFGGTIHLSSGVSGPAVQLRLPVQAAVREVVLVRSGLSTFAIPLDGIHETLVVPAQCLKQIAGRPTIINRGRLVSLLSLGEIMGESGSSARADTVEMILAGVGDQDIGLIVDEIGQHYQVVVRPLESYVASAGVTGAAVLADGEVVLVLDPSHLSGVTN